MRIFTGDVNVSIGRRHRQHRCRINSCRG